MTLFSVSCTFYGTLVKCIALYVLKSSDLAEASLKMHGVV